jgi:transcriptional regulator with XRE-family HTH domain
MRIPFTRAGIGIYLEIRRAHLGLSQRSLADRLGVSPAVYRRLAQGQDDPTDRVLEFLEIDRTKTGYVMRVA